MKCSQMPINSRGQAGVQKMCRLPQISPFVKDISGHCPPDYYHFENINFFNIIRAIHIDIMSLI